mmetsp:Transcript_33753/g.34389  ORF Transcript_33753/g.34389 Transcript_33753/m.34389 type:complete len:133 (+) Transcript_33753:55-453(+)|eukprot:CAMPEP_0182426766 /NCGR_PEP_ID=MMETSP1167-20130531/13286_1 /TAXON_ID=2988 /ORGANISM="Mallomonas Sp, Strain CCMP3275" /LENGTH=132 /DNA_ID=CAMNT_0024608439 /DNA_START=52 /DNA_END=450 /DNA_ORIENTATION=-
MSPQKIIELSEVEKHNVAKDCWIIIGNDKNGGPKVYDVTKYLDDHPGGPEIMLEFAGKDADDMFEDIGHSSEARSVMSKYLVGSLKEDPNAKSKKKAAVAAAEIKSGGGLSPMAVVLLLLAIAAGIIFSYQK